MLRVRVAQRQFVALMILAEPASAAGPGGEIDVVVCDGLGTDPRVPLLGSVPDCR